MGSCWTRSISGVAVAVVALTGLSCSADDRGVADPSLVTAYLLFVSPTRNVPGRFSPVGYYLFEASEQGWVARDHPAPHDSAQLVLSDGQIEDLTEEAGIGEKAERQWSDGQVVADARTHLAAQLTKVLIAERVT